MYNARMTFAIDNFIAEEYFLPTKEKYELKEEKESGKRLLVLAVDGEHICVEEYDKKKRCGFLREHSKFGMQKCIDHFVLKNNGQAWDLHMIEMKSSIGNKTWNDIKLKMRSSLFNVKALCVFLGITVENIYTYTTYENERFIPASSTTDPKTIVPLLGKKAMDSKRDEWDKNIMKLSIDEVVTLPHRAIQMVRSEAGELQGTLNI